MKELTISQYPNYIKYIYPDNEILLDIINGYGDKLNTENTVLNFTIEIPYCRMLQIKNIMESGHKIKNWCITYIRIKNKGSNVELDIQIVYTIKDTISIPYKNFLNFNSK